jgi:hypothetical protein
MRQRLPISASLNVAECVQTKFYLLRHQLIPSIPLIAACSPSIGIRTDRD